MPLRRSLIGPFVLIGLGLLLLYSTLRSNWAPWEVIWRYWPVLLIAWGLGRLWDYLRYRDSPREAVPARFTGGEVGLTVALILLLGWALTHRSTREPVGNYHFTQTVERQGAKSVHAEVELGAGELDLSSGAAHLLDADCYYGRHSLEPRLTYAVNGADGNLEIRQTNTGHIRLGNSGRNDWNLRFSDQVPLDLVVKMGAGTGRLHLSGLQLTHLRVEGGVGTVTVDLTGAWKQGFDGRISGGVGTVTVRLPSSVGVRVHATAGLGSVHAPGFRRDGDAYVNAAYGKSPVTLSLEIQGGIGTVNLESGS